MEDIDRILAAQRRAAPRIGATTAAERIARIRRLEDALLARRDEIREALHRDFEKPPAEVDLSEIYPVISEAKFVRRHLADWMRPQRVPTPPALLGSTSRVLYEPKGVVLIISPWNFPLNLTLAPLVSAMAAGNCAVVKPSEVTPHASACMKRILGDLFPEDEVAVVEGDASVSAALLERRFDHIFFTGSPRIGKLVMKAAAEHLTSVTLELGGKSPAIVDRTADLAEAAKKIAWGKAVNSGQVCISPDYLLVDESVLVPFREKLLAAMASLEGNGTRSVCVNDAHASRIRRMLDEACAAGAVVSGGEGEGRRIGTALVENAGPATRLMQQEIFGPLLPVIVYRSLDEVIDRLDREEKPLVLYLFSRSREVIDRVVSRTRAGATAINDTMLHFYNLHLPFGGVGQSGVGKGHGRFGFEAFSNARGIFDQRTRFAPIQLMYPPYNAFKQKLIDLTLRWL